VNLIVDTELTEFAEKVIEDFPLLTSETVLDESIYVIIRKLFALRGVRNRFDVKRRISTPEGEEIINEAIELVMELIEENDVAIVRDADIYLTMATMKEYLLLPHDARIIATMLQNGVRRLGTFDEDFKRIDEILLVPEEHWGQK